MRRPRWGGRCRLLRQASRGLQERLHPLHKGAIPHGVLLEVLKTHRTSRELEQIAQAASEFLVEALAVFEMTQRGFAELLSTLRSDQYHAEEMKAELEEQ